MNISLNYHGIDALNSGEGAATSVVHQTLVDVGAVVTIAGVALRASIAEERSRCISASNPRIHGTRPVVSGAFVHVFDASWINAFGLPTLIET